MNENNFTQEHYQEIVDTMHGFVEYWSEKGYSDALLASYLMACSIQLAYHALENPRGFLDDNLDHFATIMEDRLK